MGVKELKKYIELKDTVEKTLQEAATRLDLSARSYHKTIKLARTIADLDNEEEIGEKHILEALQYRPKSLALI